MEEGNCLKISLSLTVANEKVKVFDSFSLLLAALNLTLDTIIAKGN